MLGLKCVNEGINDLAKKNLLIQLVNIRLWLMRHGN